MPFEAARMRELLSRFDLKELFIEELGWDHHAQRLDILLDGQTYSLDAVAKKSGVVAFECNVSSLPDHATRRKIERQVTKAVHEHLIIFLDDGETTQIWQWVKRELGKPTACREHHYYRGQPGEALIQKLQPLVFSLEDEEVGLTVVDVTSRLRAGFDLDRITKKFYDRFKTEQDKFLSFIQGIPDEEMQRWYVCVTINRLMFIYFIQKKGFLDSDDKYLHNKLDQSMQAGKDRYYRGFLCPLFFEGFAKKSTERSEAVNGLLGDVPYLNGGIFQKHEIETRFGEAIDIPDAAFERIFEFFDGYHWHLDERPLRSDKEINPEVLGYIFEKYVNQKQMGAYYTKEDITEYISKNTVIPFLFDAARAECKVAFENPGGPTVWDLLDNNPDNYIYATVRHGVSWDIRADNGKGAPLDTPRPLPAEIAEGLDTVKPNLIERRKGWNQAAPSDYALPTEIWREVIARRTRYEEVRRKLVAGEVRDMNDLITLNLDIRQLALDTIQNCEGPELLRAFWHAIEKVTILDPTCGSGAFLFAALNILEPLYEACLDRMEAFIEDLRRSGQKHNPKKFSDFRKVLERTQAHPNRRYFIFKSIILNNLFGVDIMEEAAEICKLRLFLKLAAQVEPDAEKGNLGIEPLPDIDFNIRAGNTLVGFTSLEDVERSMAGHMIKLLELPRIQEQAENANCAYQLFRSMQTEQGMDAKDFAESKGQLRERLRALDDELNRYLASEYGLEPTKKNAYAKWLKSHQPFHWFVEFYGIVKAGGFDVVIGNPPYVEYKNIRRDYQVIGYATEECGNLYAFAWERSIALANTTGRIGLIIPVASVCTDGYTQLRKVWLSSGNLVIGNFNDRPGKLFDGLEHIRLAIVLLSKRKNGSRSVHTTTYNKWFTEARGQLFQTLRFTEITRLIRDGSVPKVGSELEATVLATVSSARKTLRHFVSRSGRDRIFYTRKLSGFVQILDFVPSITDGRGQKREPSELKEVLVRSKEHRNAFLCVLNSTLFYWLLTLWSDCRNLNKREVLGVPFDSDALETEARGKLNELAEKLMEHFRENSQILEMNYRKWGTLKIQCIYPKFSKPIIDKIDRVLARHYGLTEEELDFIINYDIKYRMG